MGWEAIKQFKQNELHQNRHQIDTSSLVFPLKTLETIRLREIKGFKVIGESIHRNPFSNPLNHNHHHLLWNLNRGKWKILKSDRYPFQDSLFIVFVTFFSIFFSFVFVFFFFGKFFLQKTCEMSSGFWEILGLCYM